MVRTLTSLSEGWDDIRDCSVYKAMYSLYILDFLLEEDDKENPDIKPNPLGIPDDVATLRKDWRSRFVKAGGFVTLLSILAQLVHRGVKSRMDIVLFSFILKSVTNYILAGATLVHPTIYRNVAFISTGLPLSALKSDKKETINKTGGKSISSIIKAYANNLNKNNSTPPLSSEAANTSSTLATESIDFPSISIIPPVQMEKSSSNQAPQTSLYGPIDNPEKSKETKDTEKEKDKEKEKEEQTLAARLIESEDFIQFRESIKQIGDQPITRLNVEETLQFIAKLVEETLSKSSSVDFEEINIVKLSLSVFFCLLLHDSELLKKAIITDSIKLLPEGSGFKIQGYSDLVSFLMSGLLARRNFLFARYFVNAFTVIMLECGSKEVQTILVGAVHSQVMREDLPAKSQARYIELSTQILDSICSEDKDLKILLNKDDLNKIANLEEFFFRLLDTLLDNKPNDISGENEYQPDLLVSNFKILEKVLAVEPKLKLKLSKKDGKKYISRLFRECLFNLDNNTEDNLEESIKCRSSITREACYDFLAEICRGSVQNSTELLSEGLEGLCASIPVVSSWKYTPGKERKSVQGYLGINNLHNICYINSMMQQFYMTPAFRYGILAAGEGELAAPVLDKEGRPIDDHLLRQLQKMFAFLDRSERASYSPYEFCFSLKDHSGQPISVSIQQDTQEFLNIFFDKIEHLLKPTPFKNLLSDVYGGKLIDMLGCTSCGHLRTTDQVFYNLSLEVKNFRNIKESLDKLTTEDIISDYKCESCQQKCDVTKRPLVKECPNVLLCYLSRIVFDLDVLVNVKINTRYEFPFEFNIKEYTYDYFLKEQEKEAKDGNPQTDKPQPSTTEKAPLPDTTPETQTTQAPVTRALPPLRDEDYEYTLAGVLVHRGTAEGGHYYSYINVNRLDPRRPKK